MSKLLFAAAASSMVAAPVMAAAPTSTAVAAPVGQVANVKAHSRAKKSDKLAPATLIVGALAVAAVVGGVIAVADNDKPDSN